MAERTMVIEALNPENYPEDFADETLSSSAKNLSISRIKKAQILPTARPAIPSFENDKSTSPRSTDLPSDLVNLACSLELPPLNSMSSVSPRVLAQSSPAANLSSFSSFSSPSLSRDRSHSSDGPLTTNDSSPINPRSRAASASSSSLTTPASQILPNSSSPRGAGQVPTRTISVDSAAISGFKNGSPAITRKSRLGKLDKKLKKEQKKSKKKRKSTDFNIFGASLEAVMEKQKLDHPHLQVFPCAPLHRFLQSHQLWFRFKFLWPHFFFRTQLYY